MAGLQWPGAIYGWKRIAEPRIEIKSSWKPAIYDLKISGKAEDYSSMVWKHDENSKVAGIEYPATGVEHKLAVNPSAGIIVVFFVKSPAKARKDHVVPLHRFSDIVWLIWSKHCQDAGADPAKLRHILHVTTVNRQTPDQGAVAGDKRPAREDSSEEGGDVRPPPGRKPQSFSAI